MPIRKEQFFPGGLFHVFNRGNGKQNIFNNDGDRYRFLQAIFLANNCNSFLTIEKLERNKKGFTLSDIKDILDANKIARVPLVKIYADCLMPNHYHFFIEEIKEGGISLFMKKLGISYAKYFTIKYKRPGSLFQGRFKSVQIKTDKQMMYLLAYINSINPAQLIERDLKLKGIKNLNKVLDFVENYNWSTHQEFIGKRESIIIDRSPIFNEIFPTPKSYAEFITGILRGKEKKIWTSMDGIYLE